MCHQLIHHSLIIRNPDQSLEFYQKYIGMRLMAVRKIGNCHHYFLGFNHGSAIVKSIVPDQSHCFLELVHDPTNLLDKQNIKSKQNTGYWKIALSVADLTIARQKLRDNNIEVSEAVQVPDVAYLCHCDDPDGYCIEFIQHRFEQNHVAREIDDCYALGTATTFSLVTYRVKDPQRSINFYRNILGLSLISKQVVAGKFTLYFFSCDKEIPPSKDIEDIAMREWLWQRPYALIELQHIWGTELDDSQAYDTELTTGFRGIRLSSHDISRLTQTFDNNQIAWEAIDSDPLFGKSLRLKDPDGYRIEVINQEV